MPVADAGRRGGENLVGERIVVASGFCFRGTIGTGAVDCGLLAEDDASGFRVFDRRGGGTLGFCFSSSSCISFADLNDAGEDGPCSLPMDVEGRRRMEFERLRSADTGRA